MSTKIIGLGYALPNSRITNDDLSQIMDTSDEWIVSRTGISQRYFSQDLNTSDLCVLAARKAIQDAQINPSEIDLILVATFTPDHFTPSTASLVQKKLQLTQENIMAFDLNAACSGFVYGLEVADALSRNHKIILLIGAETISKLLDFSDRSVSILFGDGAAALILKQDLEGVPMTHLNRAVIDDNEVLIAQGLNLIEDFKSINAPSFLKMQGAEVFRFAVWALEKAIKDILETKNLTLDDIDLIIPHQANQRILNYVAKSLKISTSKFYSNLNLVGNTSAASIGIALGMAKEQGLLQPNMKILLVGFGAGLTYGATLLQL